MLRLIAFAAVLLIGTLVFFQFKPVASSVTVTDARVTPMGSDGTMFVVSATLQNDGPPVALIGADAPDGPSVSLVIPEGNGPLIIPGASQGLLAMDGAHLVLSMPQGGLEEGAFQSISLRFGDGSAVVARAMRPVPMGDMEMMDHSAMADQGAGMDHGAMMGHGGQGGVMEDPAPTLAFGPATVFDASGGTATLVTEHFDFARTSEGTAHVPGQGHGHIYLNGLKLGRLYGNSLQLGALSPGPYVLRVTLNTNDHRAYMSNGAPVAAEIAFEIP